MLTPRTPAAEPGSQSDTGAPGPDPGKAARGLLPGFLGHEAGRRIFLEEAPGPLPLLPPGDQSRHARMSPLRVRTGR